MGLRLPYSRSKRYLTGIDWIVAMFNHSLKRGSGTGNTSQVILRLDRPVAETDFRDAFSRFAVHLPVLRGRMRRDVNLAPYWKIPPKNDHPAPRIETLRFAPDARDEDITRTIAARLNDPFSSPLEHLVFYLAYAGETRGFLGMKFDHLLFDARGAEALLDLFQRFQSGGNDPTLFDGISLTEPAHLDHWADMFRAGQRVNRFLLGIRNASHRTFDYSRIAAPITRFRFVTFDEPTTRAIIDTAYSDAGYLMLMPYLLAVGVEAFHAVFRRKGIDIPDYVIPASFDMRRPNSMHASLFFNHVSFLFFHVPTREIPDRPAVIDRLKEQFYDGKKSGLMKDFCEASHPLRIAPLGLLGSVARLPLKSRFGTFAFSQVGESSYRSPLFMNARVLNLFHCPRVPVPPGLGFFFNLYQSQLNLVVSYLEELLDPSDLDLLVSGLTKLAPHA